MVLLVQRYRRLCQGRPFPVIDRIPDWGTALTWVFLAGSAGFAASGGLGGSVLQRAFAKLIGIDLGF